METSPMSWLEYGGSDFFVCAMLANLNTPLCSQLVVVYN